MKPLRITSFALLLVVSGCNRPSAPEAKSPPPAQVKTVKEESLSTLTLTPQAEQRLGIEVAPVEMRKMQRTRTLPGEVILSLAGTNGIQSVYSLLPAMTPTELIRVAELQADA